MTEPTAKADPVINFLFCLGHLVGFALLVIPPLGLAILFLTLMRHNAYLKSFSNNKAK